jgi:hypothetical protein
MKTFALIFVMLISFNFGSCEKKETQPRKIETKTGLETESATNEEVDSLTNKMDKLIEGTKK